jgi:predicted chitinase
VVCLASWERPACFINTRGATGKVTGGHPIYGLAHFFAQILHKSGCMHFDMENLNYSSDGLRQVFGKYFTTRQEAVPGRRLHRIEHA